VRRSLLAASSAAFLTALVVSSTAEAGGLYAAQRGVRPLGRGGAFVAGGDDLGAIAYNPAGIFDAGGQFLIDASLLLFSSDYTRQALLRQVDPNTGETVGTFERTFSTVSGSAAPLPIPTVAVSFAPHEDWRVAFGVFAPNAVLPSYPSELEDGSPAPQRYQLLSLDGSLLATVGAYAAWRPIPELTIGLGVELLVGSFTSRQTLSGCLPERFFCSPEDPEWDIAAEIAAAPIVAPTGIVGATYHFYEGWRVGASFHLPTWISAPATVRNRLPEAAPYRNAEQIGEDASLDFQLPWEVRVGLEARDLVEGLRVEVAGNLQYWAIHDTIDVVPDGIAITNLPGFPAEYLIPDIQIPRGFQTSIAGMIGAEYTIPVNETIGVTPRAGFSYETTAVPADYHSVLTLDSGKATPSVGVSVAVGDARFDAVYAHQFIQSVETDPATARLRQIVPVQANVSETPDAINGGLYTWSIDIVGVGFAYTFDRPGPAAPSEPGPPPAVPPAAAPDVTTADPPAGEDD
jgi:long-chain fatty acid transport protein